MCLFSFLVPSPESPSIFPGNISDGLLTWDPAVMISAEPSGPEIWLGFPTKWTIYTTIKTHNMKTCYICRCICWTHCEDNMWRQLNMLEDVKDEEVCRVELTNHESLSLIADLCEMHMLKCSIFVTNNRETNCERTCSTVPPFLHVATPVSWNTPWLWLRHTEVHSSDTGAGFGEDHH